MNETVLVALAAVLALGTLAQWLSWRFHIPAILLLLMTGFLAGPAIEIVNRVRTDRDPFPLLDPEALLGELLIPLVSASVAIILFEGGLSLSLRELKTTGTVLWRLVTVGAAVTWVVGWLAGLVIGVDQKVALLAGAILVVTGPTVIGPLLRNVRPMGAVGPVLRWEGILIDPIGAVLAVFVFEALFELERNVSIAEGILRTAGVGVGVGLAGAAVLVLVIKRYLIPDFLHNAVSLALVLGAFTLANEWATEGGLVAVTVMGIALANQRFATVRHIIEFKETLRVLLISGLFIILAAQLDIDAVADVGWRGLIFLGLIVAARPLAVLVSTIGSKMSRNERIFLATVAPRGIVAAAISSVFALRIGVGAESEAIGGPPVGPPVPGGPQELVPLVFIVIVGTILLSGLLAPRVAKSLKLADQDPQGALFVGANPLARAIAGALAAEDFRVVLVDTDWGNVTAARMHGLPTHYRSFLSEEVNHQMDLGGIGRLFALTPNDELNSLSVQHALHLFGRAAVYQLAPRDSGGKPPSGGTSGRKLFGEDVTYDGLIERLEHGATVKRTTLSEEFGFEDFRERYGDAALPLFVITAAGKLSVYSVDGKPSPKPGDRLVSLVDPERVRADAPA